MPARCTERLIVLQGGVGLKLHVGTWHAGPLFDAPQMDFLNLEVCVHPGARSSLLEFLGPHRVLQPLPLWNHGATRCR